MKNLLKKLFIVVAVVVTVFMSLPDKAFALDIYGWGCRETDICDHIQVSGMCYWDSYNGFKACSED